MDMKTRIAQLLGGYAAQDLARGGGSCPRLQTSAVSWLDVPPDPNLGDYAFPCFRFAKALRMAPPKIAEAARRCLRRA